MSAWQTIRLLRARPPQLVTRDRIGVFASALEQSEQLMRAARDVGTAARPLPLFYALSQAGRAIAAARTPTGDPWRLAGHGLRMPPGQDQTTDLLRRRVEPVPESARKITTRRSSFQGVSEATGSEPLTGPVELGALWAAIPEVIPLWNPQMPAGSLDPAWRRPLVVYDEYWNAGRDMYALSGGGFPFGMLVAGLPTGTNAEQQHAILSNYPAVAGAAIRTDPHLGPVGTPAEVMTDYAPNGQDCTKIMWTGDRPKHPRLDDVAPGYRWSDVRMIFPRIADRDYLTPIMLWWAFLFGVSSIARYDPELWVATLDVNDSKQAVPIETTLETALDALPDLILQAIGP